MDYFLARYYSAAQGRFTSVDMFAAFGNPQALNRYQYGFNNPLRYIDPDGNFAIEGLVNTLTDFVIGVSRGYAASVTGGLYPGSTPTEKDSDASLAGQIVGTMIAANHGAAITGSGATLEIGSMGTGTAVAVPVAAFGYAMVAGAAGNLVRIGDAVFNKSSSSEGGGGGGQPERRAGQDVEVRPASQPQSSPEFRKPRAGLSGKEGAKDIPSWAKGQRPYAGENGDRYARRLLDEKYGKGNYPTKTNSEYSKLKKFADRNFEK